MISRSLNHESERIAIQPPINGKLITVVTLMACKMFIVYKVQECLVFRYSKRSFKQINVGGTDTYI